MSSASATRLAVLAPLALIGACFSPTTSFVCASADQCQAGGHSGACEPNGWCSYSDATCDSGSRYGDTAGGGLAGVCVGDETTGPSDGNGGRADAADRSDAMVITGCQGDGDCSPLSDACGTGTCNMSTGVCYKQSTNEGDTCGSDECGGFGGCGGFSDTCDTSGTQSRSCQHRICSSGACVLGGAFSDSQGCSRGTDGATCQDAYCDGYGACSGGQKCRTCYSAKTCSGGGCSAGGGGSSDCTSSGCCLPDGTSCSGSSECCSGNCERQRCCALGSC